MSRVTTGVIQNNVLGFEPFIESDGEQPRSCHSPNAFKDDDEDFYVSCKTRDNEPNL
ncbi:MAG TPA: hypothetical protein VE378_05890 [Nitrososphaeraceae archaeon]|nr:hypothetical protein [Nitrososphaeraceae archaeon]